MPLTTLAPEAPDQFAVLGAWPPRGRAPWLAAVLTAAGKRYAARPAEEPHAELITALDQLNAVLLPHLDRDGEEAMPVVSASITNADWQAGEQEHNLKPKSQLGMEGKQAIAVRRPRC
jgi:hypothetical protein